jgi:hypothetical protein
VSVPISMLSTAGAEGEMRPRKIPSVDAAARHAGGGQGRKMKPWPRFPPEADP